MTGTGTPKVMGIAGWSGSGKTHLVRRLIPELKRRGLRVATIKHAHHNFDVDTPGKDSYEHRAAGANEVLVSSARRWALMHEHDAGDREPTLWDLLPKLSPVDIVLVEGFKRESHPKLEVHRPALGKPLLAAEDANVVAIASDAALPDRFRPEAGVAVVDLDDVAAVADAVLSEKR
jgi:molybdopterin-guanine dinucleotide biosynthesis protein MobB